MPFLFSLFAVVCGGFVSVVACPARVGEALEAIAARQKSDVALGGLDALEPFHEPELLVELLDDVLGDVVVGRQAWREVMGHVELEVALEGAHDVDPTDALEATALLTQGTKQPARLIVGRRVEDRPDARPQLRVQIGLGRPPRLGNVAVQTAIEVHATCLEGKRSEMVVVGLRESRTEVADHALERISGVEAGFGRKTRHSVCGFHLEDECMHEVLGQLIDTDEQTMPLALDANRFAVDAEEPSPARPEFDGDLERGLGPSSEVMDPAVDGGASDRMSDALLEQDRQRSV